ncbi:MAG: hypothetical protein FWG15_00360 [Propionibacteriaceae bacterium]|nr:hypothetical protein [Propionibacteriaceae bacterium]
MPLLSDLDLHPATPLRVQPSLGEWGPGTIVTTRRKKLTRVLWILAFVIVAAGITAFAYYAYRVIT